MQKKITEATESVSKLKESVQGVLKKVKEEFTALDAKVATLASGPARTGQATPAKDQSAEIELIRQAQAASDEAILKKVAEQGKLQETIQESLK